MKVLTLNLNGYAEANRYEKLEEICEQIISEDIDIICLQEVTQYYLEDIIYDDVKYGNLAYILQLILKRLYGVQYFLELKMFESESERFDEGVAILSKKELIDPTSYQISALTLDEGIRYAVEGSYEDNDKYYQIVCTHLNNPDQEPDYDLQVTRLLNSVNFSGNIIICGDFNIEPYSKEYLNLIARGLSDIVDLNDRHVSELSTNLKLGRRIDYIFTNFNELVHTKALFTKDHVSDHIGIMIEI